MKDAGEFVSMFLRVSIAVVLISGASYLIVKITTFFNVIPERAVLYELQQNGKYSKDISKQDLDNIRVVREDLNGNVEGNLLAMLSILAVFGGMLAYIFRIVVREDLKNDQKKEEEKMRHYATAQAMKGLSVLQLYRYEDAQERDKSGKAWLEKAEKHTQKALIAALNLCLLDDNKEYELIVCMTKNNMAWIIYRKGDHSRKYEALEYSNYAVNKAQNHPEHADAWIDTNKKVRHAFFSDQTQDEISLCTQ